MERPLKGHKCLLGVGGAAEGGHLVEGELDPLCTR
jgi:hypothetical protein